MVGLSRVWLSLGLVVSLTAALLLGLPSPAGAVAGYGDVGEGTWYTDAVQWSTDNGIADSAGFCFGPDTAASRGETAVWIYNMENQPDAGDPHSFSDVTDDSQNDAISWIVNSGITIGTSRTKFASDEPLTRVKVATYLHRLAGRPSAPSHNFSDVVAGWQQDAVSWMAHTGITTGTSPTTFAPDETLTKAQLVTFLYRYQDEPHVTINTTTPTCDPAQTVVQYTIGDTIAGFPSGYAAASGYFNGVSVSITGGGSTVTVKINDGGSAAYTGATYTCTSAGGCTIVNGRVTNGTVNATTIGSEDGDEMEEMSSNPGEGTTITMARAYWSTGYFQSHLYKQLLEELGYSVTEPSELELGPSLAYLRMSQGDFDFWVNSWYPGHVYWWTPELPDGSKVGDHLTIVGNEMVPGSVQGFLITKSFADEHGVTHLDQLNDDPDILAAFDADDQSPGNGVADIYGCPESWGCDKIIDSQIAFSGWTNIAQVKAGYDAMFAEARIKADAGEPMVIYTWTPSDYIAQLRPGDNVVWLAVEDVLDDSNPTGLEGGEGHDQRPGQANISPEAGPAAADADTCQLGWFANNIQVTANTEWLNANPYAAELLCQVTLSVIDVSDAVYERYNAASYATEDFIAGLAADWISDNRALVDGWLEAARMSPMEPTCPDTVIPMRLQ